MCNGDGTFQTVTTYPAGFGTGSLHAADLNGDGKLDLVAVQKFGAGTVVVLLGNGDGTFQAFKQYFSGAGTSPLVSLDVGDLNQDGKLDVVVTNPRG